MPLPAAAAAAPRAAPIVESLWAAQRRGLCVSLTVAAALLLADLPPLACSGREGGE